VRRSATILDVVLDEGGAWAIAARSRGTPRVANRLLKRVRDWAEVRGSGVVDDAAADAALAMLEVDELGLDRLDREILTTICAQFAGGPVGSRRWPSRSTRRPTPSRTSTSPTCSSAGSSSARLAGRAATARAYEHLGLDPPRESALF
jgi:Holliday junction DNA helicase RuvB